MSNGMLELMDDRQFLDARKKHGTEAFWNQCVSGLLAAVFCTSPVAIGLLCTDWLLEVVQPPVYSHEATYFAQAVAALVVLAGLAASGWAWGSRVGRLARRLNGWRNTPVHQFCPACKFHMPTTLPWSCPRCATINAGDNNHSYFGTCSNCQMPPQAILCQRCRRVIRLCEETPVLCIAMVAGRHTASETTEPTDH